MVSWQHSSMTEQQNWWLAFLLPPQKSAILTTVGVLEQPLGNARLHVARLVAALLQTNAPSICQELCNLATMDLLLVSLAWLTEMCLNSSSWPDSVCMAEKVASDLHKVSHEEGNHWLSYHTPWPKGSGCDLCGVGSAYGEVKHHGVVASFLFRCSAMISFDDCDRGAQNYMLLERWSMMLFISSTGSVLQILLE